jgi:hypothetical protein
LTGFFFDRAWCISIATSLAKNCSPQLSHRAAGTSLKTMHVPSGRRRGSSFTMISWTVPPHKGQRVKRFAILSPSSSTAFLTKLTRRVPIGRNKRHDLTHSTDNIERLHDFQKSNLSLHLTTNDALWVSARCRQLLNNAPHTDRLKHLLYRNAAFSKTLLKMRRLIPIARIYRRTNRVNVHGDSTPNLKVLSASVSLP